MGTEISFSRSNDFLESKFLAWLTNSFGGLVVKKEEEGSEGMNSYRDGRQFLVRKKPLKSDGLLDIRNRSRRICRYVNSKGRVSARERESLDILVQFAVFIFFFSFLQFSNVIQIVNISNLSVPVTKLK